MFNFLLWSGIASSSSSNGPERVLNEFFIPWSQVPVVVYQACILAFALSFIHFIYNSIKNKTPVDLMLITRGFVLFFFIWQINVPFKTSGYTVKVPFAGQELIISNNEKTINYPCESKSMGECFKSFKESNNIK